VTRRDQDRLDDIVDALRAIESHLQRGTLDDGLVFDAVRLRLIEIGEAVKGIGAETLALERDIPWVDIAGMRDRLTHHYFDTSHALVQATIEHDLPALADAVTRLRLGATEQS